MFRIRLLLVAVALSSAAGCCSSPCGGHPWFNWCSSRNCCATPSCNSCDSCGTTGSSGYSVVGSPIFAAPAVNGNLPPTVVPGPMHPAVPPAGAQQNLARPIPYVPNGK